MNKLSAFMTGVVVAGIVLSLLPSNLTRTTEKTPLSVTIKETPQRAKDFDIVKTTKYKYSESSMDTVHLKLSTLERDIRTTSTKPTQNSNNSQLLQKIITEYGKENLELWVNFSNTGIEDEKDREWWNEIMAVTDKIDKLLEKYGKDKDELMGYVVSKGYCDEEENWYWRYGATPKPDVNELFDLSHTNNQSQLVLTSQSTPIRKDYRNNRYSDDFVNKYKLDKKYIKTEADRAFEKMWNEYLREMANDIQHEAYGTVDVDCIKGMASTSRIKSYSPFLSPYCKGDWIEKQKLVNYKLKQVEDTKRL